MTELETQFCKALHELFKQQEIQSDGLSRLVHQQSNHLNSSAAQVTSLSEQVNLLTRRVTQLSAQVQQFSGQLTPPTELNDQN